MINFYQVIVAEYIDALEDVVFVKVRVSTKSIKVYDTRINLFWQIIHDLRHSLT
jgi:hypothetical protein